MRENSGKGEATHNNLNPTLEEHKQDKAKQPQNLDLDPNPEENIVGNAKKRGEDPSPDDRGRGETSVADKA